MHLTACHAIDGKVLVQSLREQRANECHVSEEYQKGEFSLTLLKTSLLENTIECSFGNLI